MAKNRIERDDAYNIASKIGATVEKTGKHARATLRINGKIILTFGIRHGPRSGHGHLCGANGDLKLSESNVVALARCTLSTEDYFAILRTRGIIPE